MYQQCVDLNRKRQEAQVVLKSAVVAPLDTAITLIDKYVPQEAERADAVESDVALLQTDALTTATKLALISRKLRVGLRASLQSAKSLSQERLAQIQHTSALLQYSSKYIDALQITKVGDTLLDRADDAKRIVEEKLVAFNLYVAQTPSLARIHATVSPIVGSLKTTSQRVLFVSLTALATVFETTTAGSRSLWNKTTGSLDETVHRVASGVKVYVAKLDSQVVLHLLEITKTTRWINDVLQKEAALVATNSWSYVQSIKLVAEIQRKIRALLRQVGQILPTQSDSITGSKFVESKALD